MKPLPDMDDTGAMAAAGRRSVLGRARNEAAEALRNAFMQVQSSDISNVAEPAQAAIEAAQRLIEVCTLWSQL